MSDDKRRREVSESNSKAACLRHQLVRNRTPHPMDAPRKKRRRHEPDSKAYYAALDVPLSPRQEIEEDLLWGE